MNDAPDIYTNAIRVSASLYEITLAFLLQTPLEDGSVDSKEIARVRMSPQQAMALEIVLKRHLNVYGELWQEIFLPDELVTRLSGGQMEETT